MPYAQDHYPFEGKDSFESNFPAQFIAEGLDQTRGWFYTLLVLSTALFDKEPFSNVIVNGMVLAEDGSKMSKSKRNYPPPEKMLNEFGADALRAYLINSPIVRAEPMRFSEVGVRDVVRTVLIPLRNAWSFFVQYANIDGWHPVTGLDGEATPDLADRPAIDRWLLSVQQSLVGEVNRQMEGYYLYRVVPPILGFIDDLTNWYIRQSRRRFWRSADDVEGRRDKAAAYATLYEALVTFAKVMAPVLPFITDAVYQNLVVAPGVASPDKDSVHLCDYPEVDVSRIDTALEQEQAVVRSVCSLGRALREKHKLKTRQPLRKVIVVHHETAVTAAVETNHAVIAQELNVKEVEVQNDGAALSTLSFKANFKRLGRRLGGRMKAAAGRIAGLTADEWTTLSNGGQLIVEDEPITAEDVMVSRQSKGDVVIEVDGALTVALDPVLDEELTQEGWARELISRVQRARKDTGLAVVDRIELILQTADAELSAALMAQVEYISNEVLANDVRMGTVNESAGTVEIDGREVILEVRRVPS